MTAKIVVVGSFNMDLTAYMARLPRPGETVSGSRFVTGPGGKGSNQAVAAARLGADVTFVGKVGTDTFGDMALQMWAREGINTRYVVRDPNTATGVAPIFVEEGTGQNSIVVVLGANLTIETEDVDGAEEAIARADVVMTQLEVAPKIAVYAMRLAARHGVCTVLNPAPASALPTDMLLLADYLTPNETELEVLTGNAITDVEASARTLLSRDSQQVIVTLGEQGAQRVDHVDSQLAPAFPVQVVDTTGAGDAFNAGFAVAISEGRDVDDAVRFANAVAALSVTRAGTSASMPTREEVEGLLAGK